MPWYNATDINDVRAKAMMELAILYEEKQFPVFLLRDEHKIHTIIFDPSNHYLATSQSQEFGSRLYDLIDKWIRNAARGS